MKQIKREVKAVLVERAVYQEDWKVNWVTDGESKQLNATNPNLHPEIGMKIFHRSGSHTGAGEWRYSEAVSSPEMKKVVQKPQDFIIFMKDYSLAEVAFHNTMLGAGETPLAIIHLEEYIPLSVLTTFF